MGGRVQYLQLTHHSSSHVQLFPGQRIRNKSQMAGHRADSAHGVPSVNTPGISVEVVCELWARQILYTP